MSEISLTLMKNGHTQIKIAKNACKHTVEWLVVTLLLYSNKHKKIRESSRYDYYEVFDDLLNKKIDI